MTAYSWIGGTGNWKVGSNWRPSSPAGPPGANDTATISATGPAYTVTINSADVAKSLTENSASATVDDYRSLTLSGTFTLSAGTFVLGGTLSGGTTKLTGGTFVCDGGTLSGVTYDGTLDLSESGADVALADGTVVNNAAGTGAGTINDTGENSALYFGNTQTFNNATIELGNTRGYSYLNDDSTGAATVLTLGSGVTIDESGYAEIYTGGDGIVSQGNINQTASGGYLFIAGDSTSSFTNSGTITASASGGELMIDTATLTNSGTLAISNGDAVTIESIGIETSFSNTGSITLASGGSLDLDTSFTLAELGKVTNSGGTVYIGGALDNTGGTLNGSGGLGQAVLDGGAVQGGTATPSGLVLSPSGGTLSGVTYDGALDLSGFLVSVHLASGTVVNNAAGNGAGTINDTGAYSTLYFDNTQTFNNATIDLGTTSSGANSNLWEYDLTVAETVLTLGSGVTIDESGDAQIYAGGDAGDDAGDIVDQGKISQTASGGDLVIGGNSFTNGGTITAASSGGILAIDTDTFTNNGAIDISNGETVTIDSITASLSGTTSGVGTLALAGGSATIDSGAKLSISRWSISGAGTDVTLDENLTYAQSFSEGAGDTLVLSGGHLLLTGAATFAGGTVDGSKLLETEGATTVSGLTIGGTVKWENTESVTQDGGAVTIGDAIGDEAVLHNTSTGTYDITDDSGIDRGSSTASGIKNAGLIEKTGGTGVSTIVPNVTNNGTIKVTSGTLDFTGRIFGTGSDTISGASKLQFDAEVLASQTVDFTGSGGELELHGPAVFAGSISGFDTAGAGSNDTILVAAPWVFSGFAENAGGTEGTLGFMSGASTLSLKLIGDYNPADFVHHTRANGSTLITYT